MEGPAWARYLPSIDGADGGRDRRRERESSGSTFWFSARLERIPMHERKSLNLPEGLSERRVLVAESSAAMREVLHQQLQAWGIEHEVRRQRTEHPHPPFARPRKRGVHSA